MKAKLIVLVLTGTLTSGAFSQEKPTTVESRIGKLEFTHDFANGYPSGKGEAVWKLQELPC